MKSTGKRFEENFKKSVPEDIFYYRLKDNSNTWSEGTKTRFTPSNICDCIMFDGNYLYILELKSTKGKNLPFNNIKKHQIDDLLWASNYANIVAGFLINFSDLDECYFIEINDFNEFYETTERKSLGLDYCRENGVKIGVERLKINKKYDVEKMIDDIVKEVI